jgi:5S rRNA maturation endonuclease (ribonuclease M5)
LSTKTEKKLEKLNKLLERLEKLTAKGIPIIVEGRNDVLALNRLGIFGDFILTKTGGKSFLDVVSEIDGKNKGEVVLLLDFDRPGKEWTSRLSSCLERMKITPNLVFWRTLFALVGRDVKDIEGFATFIENLTTKRGVS